MKCFRIFPEMCARTWCLLALSSTSTRNIAIRAEPSLARTRLVALTGYGQPSDRARALTAGFETHLVKPVEWEAIAGILERGLTTDERS